MHQLFEIGPQRRAAVACQRRAHPSGLRRIPGRLHVALPTRGGRQPVDGCRARRCGSQLRLHPLANVLVHGLTLEVGPRPRVAIEGAGPPIDHALALAAGQRPPGSVEHRIEDVRGRAVRSVEIQRLAEPDDELDALARTESLRIEAAKALASAA